MEENHTHPPNTDGSAVRREPNEKKPFSNRTAQEAKAAEKIRVLTRTLKPVPFKAAKNLDFARHETLLRRIGLWDFVHVEFDRDIRVDLVAQLIASYKPNLRCGYVNGVRVLANRTQLGHALRLPLSEKGEVFEGVLERLDFAESVEFVEEFLWNWVVLNGDDDDDECVMVMPSEVLECGKLIRQGCLEKVDWAGLVWSMVEREMREIGLVKCYYASHLQLLIKVQHEELMREVPIVEVEDDEFEKHKIELSLAKDNAGKVELQTEEVEEEHKLGFDEYKEEPVFGLNDNVGEPFLRQCNANVNGLDCREKEDEEGEQEEEEEVEDEHEVIPLEGMSSGSGDTNHAMQEVQMPLISGIDLNDNSVGDFISSQDDPQMICGPSFFGNGRKRDIGLGYHNKHHSLNESNKRLRIDNQWNAEPVDFDTCIDQIQHWMGKARLMYETKNGSCEDTTMNEQLLLNELQNQDSMIEHLCKAVLDESQKGEMNVYRLEKELYMMAKLVEGYRKALRETQKAFDEYRAQCPQADEPFYKDVPGSGGLVLSVVELEKVHLRQQEEERMKRLAIEKKLERFSRRLDWQTGSSSA